jgi:hypothetical protein
LNNQVKEDEMGGSCSSNGGEEKVTCDIGGKAGRKPPRWVKNIKMYLAEIGRGGRTGLVWLRIGTCGGLL